MIFTLSPSSASLGARRAGLGFVTALALAAGLPATAGELPHGRPGECFEKVRLRPPMKSVEERIPVAPLITYRTTAAVYADATRQVRVRPALTTYETRPAVYRTVSVWRSRPGPWRTIWRAAVYRTVFERTLIAPAHLEWRRGRAAEGFAADGASAAGVQEVTPTGEVICRILVPARYAAVRRRVLVSAEERRRVQGPDRKILCYERVLVSPARRIGHTTPAVYRTVTFKKLVTPATRSRVATPQPDRIVHRLVPAGPAQSVWRKIRCRVPARPMTPPRAGGERG